MHQVRAVAISSLIWVLSLSLGFDPSPSHAQSITTSDLSANFFNLGDALSFGSAHRALANNAQAVLYNPAGITQLQGQMLARFDYASIGMSDSNAFAISMVDFQTSKSVAYGVAYYRDNPNIGGNQASVNQVLLSGGKKMGSFLIGASAKGYWVNIDNPLLEGPKGIDMDLGLLFQPMPILSVAFTAYNLIQGQSIEEFPFMLAGGIAFKLADEFTITADLTKDFKTPNTSSINSYFGAEFLASPKIALRAGYAIDKVRNNDFYSLGLQAGSSNAKILFTFSQRLSPKSEVYAASVEFYF
ncbi:MAG: hypothetical protein KDD52_03080 [Bdellovibrionales bacterium]|nr:hypothetical protein [Bdellovibrionales bacterium]